MPHEGLSIVGTKPSIKRRWLDHYISPGAVGSVGDAHVQPRLKQSAPDFPFKFSPEFSHKLAPWFGTNVPDGQHLSYAGGGGPAYTIDSNWGGRRNFKTAHGWYYQDLRAPDKLVSELNVGTPGYDWNNRLATNYRERHTGSLFLPLPGPYQLGDGEIPRGGRYPVTSDIVGGEVPALGGTGQIEQQIGVNLPGLNQLFSAASALTSTGFPGSQFTQSNNVSENQHRRMR